MAYDFPSIWDFDQVYSTRHALLPPLCWNFDQLDLVQVLFI